MKFSRMRLAKKLVKQKGQAQKLAYKVQLKKLGKLSLALLGFKFMVDHHQDEITKDNENTLLKLYNDAKKKKAANKTQRGTMQALASLSPKDVRSQINNTGKLLGQVGDAVSDASQVNLGSEKKTGESLLNQLANMFGFNPSRIKSSFTSLFQGLRNL